ncbi:MAG: GTP-binding protein [Rhodospirillaceae bacterium]|nr:GTP-binding protein [Rhodospirillaceae bacterium]MBT4689068.1 GTP-binding protein [Rhodospirillaceae bacterium]MBT5082107.1 GTP-binding protein [Rhodospirillaceae bacterium]MBT5523580.1 GTP-binding protein [Rhodospirillaceae bacterium]MBT5879023.1 GTP-binding protein [Rhodospirillaceae bacterium]
MIPVTVIGGYLGAGKTTLINGLLGGDHGRRLAVLVNDFGEINIDAALITAHDGDTISLANGCVCCTIADALGTALDNVLGLTPAPDHIVIEASGVANPAKIAMYGQGWPGLRLDGIVTVVDGDSVRARSTDKFVGTTVMQQLAAAELLILNKMDLLSERQHMDLQQWLRGTSPQATIVETIFGQLPAEILLGQYGDGISLPDGAESHGDFETAAFRTDRPLDRARLMSQIAAWPAGVLRAKGLLHLTDDPAHRYILQLVGKRCTLEMGPPWLAERPDSQIVVISAGLDMASDWLEASLSAVCL